jgi:hypothetical protein
MQNYSNSSKAIFNWRERFELFGHYRLDNQLAIPQAAMMRANIPHVA